MIRTMISWIKEESTQRLYEDKLPKIEEDREEEDTLEEAVEQDEEY
jgi:hypothetical protein